MSQYREPAPIARSEAVAALSSGDLNKVREALVSIAFHDPDFEWAQAQCLDFCANPDPEVRGVAVVCLGHIARIHGRIDMEKVGPVLKKLASDSQLVGIVQDALDDIRQFAKGDE